MAVENDYNPLVSMLNDLADTTVRVRNEVHARQMGEKGGGLEPNVTHWVHLLAGRLPLLSDQTKQLEAAARKVIGSSPGEAVFEAQSPSAPWTPPPD